jgi:ParB-like chromosome segregation protein Spo0J
MKIPISKIRPNPNNPRHIIRPELIDDLAASNKIFNCQFLIKNVK